MPQIVEAASYLEDLPEFQKEQFWNIVENRGHGPNSYLSSVPMAVSPDGGSVLHITLRPSEPLQDLLGEVAISPTSRYDGGVTEDLPVMDKQDMLILAR